MNRQRRDVDFIVNDVERRTFVEFFIASASLDRLEDTRNSKPHEYASSDEVAIFANILVTRAKDCHVRTTCKKKKEKKTPYSLTLLDS